MKYVWLHPCSGMEARMIREMIVSAQQICTKYSNVVFSPRIPIQCQHSEQLTVCTFVRAFTVSKHPQCNCSKCSKLNCVCGFMKFCNVLNKSHSLFLLEQHAGDIQCSYSQLIARPTLFFTYATSLPVFVCYDILYLKHLLRLF